MDMGSSEKTRSFTIQLAVSRAGLAIWVAIASGVLVLSGCAHLLKDNMIYDLLDYPGPTRTSPSQVPETLMVYRFLLAPTVDSYSLVITKSAGKEQSLAKHRWNHSPADMITDLIQRDLDRAGPFSRTVSQFSNVSYRYALEGKIVELHGLERKGKIFAVVKVEVVLTDFEAPPGRNKSVLKQNYSVETPCRDSEAQSVVQGLVKGTQEFSERLRRDITAALRSSRPDSFKSPGSSTSKVET